MKYPPPMPYTVMEIANIYTLLQIGLTYTEIQDMPAEVTDMLLILHSEIKTYEKDEMEKSNKSMRKR